MILAVQHGNTSEPVALQLQAAGKVASVRYLCLPRHRRDAG